METREVLETASASEETPKKKLRKRPSRPRKPPKKEGENDTQSQTNESSQREMQHDPFSPSSPTQAPAPSLLPERPPRTETIAARVKRKKILYFITKANWGGAQRHVYDLATHIPRREYKITVALGGDGPLQTRLEEAGVRTVSISSLGRDVSIVKDIVSFVSLWKIVKTESPDILHVHSSKAGGLGALIGRLIGVPRIVFTAHGWPFKERRSGLQKQILYFLSWITAILAHAVIVVSNDDRERGAELPFIKNKLRLVYNGVKGVKFLDRTRARETLLSDGNFWGDGYLWIGTIAELHKNKGLEYAIRAVADLIADDVPELRNTVVNFMIIGEGEERPRLEALIEELGMGNRIFLRGHKDQAIYLLKAFDIFLLPSVKEGLPYAILEAGLAKLPVIATAVGGIPEIIADMESGIVVRPHDAQQIKEALLFMILNPDKRELFGKELHRKVTSFFSLERMTTASLAVYNTDDE